MLGQSKTAYQAEIDTPCELIDFWRFNVAFARDILADQPVSSRGVWNRVDHRPLEGFVYAITPFNFTAIAGNLPTAPALMGNVVVWKPSPTQALSAYLTMQLLEAAGLPGRRHQPGPRRRPARLRGRAGRPAAGRHPLHRQHRDVPAAVARGRHEHRPLPHLPAAGGGDRRQGLRPGPRLRRPRGPHHRDDPRRVRLPGPEVLGGLAGLRAPLGLVADGRQLPRAGARAALRRRDRPVELRRRGHRPALLRQERGRHRAGAGHARASPSPPAARSTTPRASSSPPRCCSARTRPTRPSATSTSGRSCRSTSTRTAPPPSPTSCSVIDTGTPYALTGAVIATDRTAVAEAAQGLRFAAGNFYVNDKPTGAVVGQQPFGGARASGTNDKAGSPQNLLRWTSARSMKETFVPAAQPPLPAPGAGVLT